MTDHVGPTGDQLERLSERRADQPVLMLNLLRFRDRARDGHGVDGVTGREAYREYGRRLADAGPEVFAGQPIATAHAGMTVIGPDADQWDELILVRYPTLQSFLDMVADPRYQEISRLRSAALADSRLIAFDEP